MLLRALSWRICPLLFEFNCGVVTLLFLESESYPPPRFFIAGLIFSMSELAYELISGSSLPEEFLRCGYFLKKAESLESSRSSRSSLISLVCVR